MTHLNVSETFLTHQGEGRHAGALSWFIRLAGCNLACSWCDAAYTWDWSRYNQAEEVHPSAPTALVELMRRKPAQARVVVTGGEPLLQAPGLAEFFRLAREAGLTQSFDLETNGTRPLGETAFHWSTITVSPKVTPSAMTLHRGADRISNELFDDIRAEWKFVVKDSHDLEAATRFATDHGLPPSRCWLMPEGTDASTIEVRSRYVADQAIRLGWNATTRAHIFAYGNERGR